MNNAIVIGAGVAGLASAVRLQAKGYSVKVIESNSYYGGKLSEIRLGDYRFDAGPSLFTMPHFVDDVLKLSSEEPRDFFNYVRKEIVCNYFWEDGLRFSAKSDPLLFSKDCAEAFKVEEKQVLNYIQKAKSMYNLTDEVFLKKSLHKSSTYFSKSTLKAVFQLYRLNLRKNINQVNESTFSDPRLVQYFNRYATYNGSNPYKAPGILCMIPHLEHNIGTFFPKGGMIEISKALFKAGKKSGVDYHFNQKVDEIIVEDGAVKGVQAGAERLIADVVVSNADIVPTYKKLLPKTKGPEKTLNQERSSSALIFYWGINKSFAELDLHNIFFSDNYKAEFDAIANGSEIYDDPTIYIHISSKDHSIDAPKGCENWFVMINVPANKGQDWDELIVKAKENIISKINRLLSTKIKEHIVEEDYLDPRRIESRTSSFQGALYGASSNNKFAAFLRHPNFSKSIKGLYFCGGSVHPGGGIPLCLLSAQIVSDLVPFPKK